MKNRNLLIGFKFLQNSLYDSSSLQHGRQEEHPKEHIPLPFKVYQNTEHYPLHQTPPLTLGDVRWAFAKRTGTSQRTGIYRYQPERHALELVRTEIHPSELYRVLRVPLFNMHYMSVSLFPVGNYTSGFQVYGDRWYRIQSMEAGIITQRLYLAAAAQNLGCRASLSFSVPDTNKFLGLSDAKDDQHTSLIQLMVAPERPAYQYYEQSLLQPALG